MKKFLIIFIMAALFIGCGKTNKAKEEIKLKGQYIYVEKRLDTSSISKDKMKEERDTIFAENDSLAYVYAYRKFCISQEVVNKVEKETGILPYSPISFSLYDDKGNAVLVKISNETLASIRKENNLEIMGGDGNSGKDSVLMAKLKPLFSFKGDEFDANGTVWVTPKSAPKYVDVNSIYCYFAQTGNSVSNFRIKIQYRADEWLFIRKYQFLIDGKPFEFIPSKMERDNRDYIWEWCDEAIGASDEELIKALANAKTVKVKFIGDQYHDIRKLSSKEIKGIKNTYDLYKAMGGTF